jgi:hypothetical protein
MDTLSVLSAAEYETVSGVASVTEKVAWPSLLVTLEPEDGGTTFEPPLLPVRGNGLALDRGRVGVVEA